MKRKLEAELISIAHRILKLKNKSELAQLQQETLKLYEKISVLRFVEENFSEVKPTIGYANAEKEVEAIYEAEENAEITAEPLIESEPITTTAEVEEVQPEVSKDSAEDQFEADSAKVNVEVDAVEEEEIELAEEISEEELEALEGLATAQDEDEDEFAEEPEVEFTPFFEIASDEEPQKVVPRQITLEDFLTEGHVEPIFVRAEQVYSNETTTTQINPEDEKETVTKVEVVETKKTEFVIDHHEPKTVSLNDSLSKSINIGLNDRIGFEKHLFGGSSEDLNRVLSQLSTYANFGEAQNFIEEMVKPDYNNWAGKEEYEARFMEIVEKKFA